MQPMVIIACGALAREIKALIRANGWHGLRLECLPASLHNRPERIPEAVRGRLAAARRAGARVFVAYADCGTGGRLDRVLEEFGAERLPGAHCYDFYAGQAVIAALAEEQPGTFYLTDFLVRHFDRLVLRDLGIERHPELAAVYFGNYRRLVYLSQRDDPQLGEAAEDAARRLGLDYEYRPTGYGELGVALGRVVGGQSTAGELPWPH